MAVMALRSIRADDAAVGLAPAHTPPAHFADVDTSLPTIHAEDLLPDALGEVVLHNDSSLRVLNLATTVPVLSHGESPAHVTLAGDDVTGFNQLKLANGITVFYPRELIVSVTLHATA